MKKVGRERGWLDGWTDKWMDITSTFLAPSTYSGTLHEFILTKTKSDKL